MGRIAMAGFSIITINLISFLIVTLDVKSMCSLVSIVNYSVNHSKVKINGVKLLNNVKTKGDYHVSQF